MIEIDALALHCINLSFLLLQKESSAIKLAKASSMVGFQSVNTTRDVQNFLRPGKDNIPCVEKNYTSVAAACSTVCNCIVAKIKLSEA